MLGLKKMSYVSLTMALIICLTLTLNGLTKAQEAKLIGTVYCDTCFHQYLSPSSHFISGALVAVECGGDEIEASGWRPRFQELVKTDVKGEFRVTLPFSATKHVNEIKKCAVRLISSSEPDCAIAAGPTATTTTTSSIRLKVKTPENHVFSAGFFTFQPLEQPKRCRWESHANANDEIIASPPLPSHVVDVIDWNPVGRDLIHELADENNLRFSDPFNQIMPPLVVPSQQPPRSILTPVVPLPPDNMLGTAFQPPPNSMLDTGFQPPPDSMINTGFGQPPPDSMLNTGFGQPPPDSIFNRDFQTPPPDSMFNTGFQPPPPDSTADPTQPSPPSLIPRLPTPPSLSPSVPSPPLEPQRDLMPATPPPPPFNQPFPAFPFQPSAGLPRMPPRTRIPPLLYK